MQLTRQKLAGVMPIAYIYDGIKENLTDSAYKVGFPLGCAAYVDLVERDAEKMVHERVLQQTTDERPLPVVLFHEPAKKRAQFDVKLTAPCANWWREQQ